MAEWLSLSGQTAGGLLDEAIWGLFPAQGMILSAFIHLPAVCLAMMLGARFYREKGDSTTASTEHTV